MDDRRRRSLWLRGGAVSDFIPQDLFSGEDGFIIDPNQSTMYTDEAQTTEAGVGDPVWWIMDASGNGNHWQASTEGNRGILREGDNGWYLENSGIGDGMRYLSPQPGVEQDTTVCLVFERASEDFTIQGAETQDAIFMMGSDADADVTRHIIPTSPVILVNGVEESYANRIELKALYDGLIVATVEGFQRSLDYFVDAEDRLTHFSFTDNIDYDLHGTFWGEVEIARSLTTDERDRLEAYFADKAGVTLS